MLNPMGIGASGGEKTKMLIDEGGRATVNSAPAAGDEVRKNSMTLASLCLDSIADLFAHGADEYNLSVYQGEAAWQVTTGASSRFRLPICYAASMFNNACGGKTQVAVDVPNGVPTLQRLVPDGSKLTPRGEVTAISVRLHPGGQEILSRHQPKSKRPLSSYAANHGRWRNLPSDHAG